MKQLEMVCHVTKKQQEQQKQQQDFKKETTNNLSSPIIQNHAPNSNAVLNEKKMLCIWFAQWTDSTIERIELKHK